MVNNNFIYFYMEIISIISLIHSWSFYNGFYVILGEQDESYIVCSLNERGELETMLDNHNLLNKRYINKKSKTIHRTNMIYLDDKYKRKLKLEKINNIYENK